MSRSVERREAVQRAARLGEIRPLTRRERAAMTLALEVLRRSVVGRWCVVVRTARAVNALSAAECILGYGFRYPEGPLAFVLGAGGPEAIRARLALYLRARLRADRGDCGPRVGECEACDGTGDVWDSTVGGLQCWDCAACDGRGLRDRITPLWQHAALRQHPALRADLAMEGM